MLIVWGPTALAPCRGFRPRREATDYHLKRVRSI